MVRTAFLIVSVVAIGTAAAAQSNRPALQSMTGIATAVSATSLTLDVAGNEATFQIAGSTRYTGKGLASDLVLRPPRKITDVVKRGDRVTVKYRVVNSAMKAVEIRIGEK